MKRILASLFAAAILLAWASPGQASDSGSYYPITVEEYTYGDFDEPRINKTYQLSLSDDPSLIPTEDFVRNGRRYSLLDMTRKDELGVDTQSCTQTVTLASDTDDLETILQKLGAELEVTTEDCYTETLRLDHTTVQVTADGYATKTKTVTATRTYPNLSDADLTLVPKTITENGNTLTLADVDWSSSEQTEAGGTVLRYCATASYTGTTSTRYATGYTVTADYTGEVSKTDCDVVTYTAIFGSVELPEDTSAKPQSPASDTLGSTETPAKPDTPSTTDTPPAPTGIKRPLLIGGAVLAAGVGGVFAFKKFRERR